MDTRKINLKIIGSKKSWMPALALACLIGTVGNSAALAHSVPSTAISQQSSAEYHKWLKKKVYERLVTIPWYSVFDNLDYKIQGTKVTLLGQVVFPLSHSSVEGYVKGIAGVTRIVNHIQNLPVSPYNAQIRWAEYRALFFEGSPLFHYSLGVTPRIHIIVNNGRVTLVGVVDSKADREFAGMRARTVPDVFKVVNDLRVA
jgi:hyperosmotically inducible protein